MKTSWRNAQWAAFEDWPSPHKGHECQGPSAGEGPHKQPGSFAVLLLQPFLSPAAPSAAAGTSSQEPGACSTPPAGRPPTASETEQLTGAPDEPTRLPTGPQQDPKPSHGQMGQITPTSVLCLCCQGHWSQWWLPLGLVCFVWWVGASSWTPGGPSPPSCAQCPLAAPRGDVGAHRGGVGWPRVPVLPDTGWAPPGVTISHGRPRAGASFTPTGDWQGNEEANPNRCGTARELFSLVCFSLQEKKRAFSWVWLMLCDLWHPHGSALWSVLQVKVLFCIG